MQQLLERLESWAKAHAGRSLGLRKGTTEAAIREAEATMQLTLPEDYRAFLLLHDGQEGREGELFEWMPGCSPLKPLDAVVSRWKEEQDLADGTEGSVEGALHTVMFHPRRIPIAGTPWWDGDNTYLDLFPSPAGRSGQLIMFVSECDLVLLGPSFRAALELYVAALERGDWVFSKEKGHVMPADELPNEHPHESNRFSKYVAQGT